MQRLSRCSNSVWHYVFLLSFVFLATLLVLSSSFFMSLKCTVNWHYQHVISSAGEQFINKELVGCRDAFIGHLSKLSTTERVEAQAQEFVQEEIRHIESIPQSSFDSCAGRRIYMYNLPAAFNALLLQQCSYKIVYWINFCPHILNYGFGKTANYSSDSPNDSADWTDWYETDFYMLEVIFHSRMAVYPCRTQSARDADAFFIPYYSALDALRYLFGDKIEERSEQGKELVRWLIKNEGGQYWHRRGGHDHFIVMGRTAWDFNRAPLISRSTTVKKTKGEEAWDAAWGTSFASLPEMENVTTLFLERRPWGSFEQAIPYPTSFHPTSLRILHAWQDKVRVAKRTFLMAFVGAPRPPVSSTSELRSIRQTAIDQCMKNASACTLVDCRKMQCATEPVRIAQRMLDAHFCLQPPGDTSTRRSTFDGLISGCIPVFFTNDSAYTQYTWHLPAHEEVHPSSYSVFVPSDEIQRLVPLLSSFSTEHIVRMRTFIVEQLIPRVIYAHPELATSHPTVRDAFQLTVDNMLSRVATN